MKNSLLPKVRSENIIIQELADETLIYDLQADRAFCLNETLSHIWKLCDGTNSIGEIAVRLSRSLKSFVSEDIIWLALDQFKEDDLLLNPANFVNPDFSELSRRQMIRKAALSSAIALPIISAMVVPSSAQAQASCLAIGMACTLGGAIPCCPGTSCQLPAGNSGPRTCQV